jgi:hypothetical protein
VAIQEGEARVSAKRYRSLLSAGNHCLIGGISLFKTRLVDSSGSTVSLSAGSHESSLAAAHIGGLCCQADSLSALVFDFRKLLSVT